LITKSRYVPSNFPSKLVQRFPSLTVIELHVFSFDDCISDIDILLSHLENLSYLRIYYSQVSLLDHSFSRSYIIDKRRQAFGFNIIDEHKVIHVQVILQMDGPDSILLSFGEETRALNCGVKLHESGILQKYSCNVLG
ncbi:unnamed protein product, partial [Rotaria sp. Silwood2]